MEGARPPVSLTPPRPTYHPQARFIKLCKESGLVGRQLTTTDCDLIFAKAKERAARKVTFEQAGRLCGWSLCSCCHACCNRASYKRREPMHAYFQAGQLERL